MYAWSLTYTLGFFRVDATVEGVYGALRSIKNASLIAEWNLALFVALERCFPCSSLDGFGQEPTRDGALIQLFFLADLLDGRGEVVRQSRRKRGAHCIRSLAR